MRGSWFAVGAGAAAVTFGVLASFFAWETALVVVGVGAVVVGLLNRPDRRNP